RRDRRAGDAPRRARWNAAIPETNGPRPTAPDPRSPARRPTEPPMTQDPHVVRRQVEITNAYGLHLRPADKFVTLANQFRAEVRVHYKGKEYNGKSILELTTLAAECGTKLEL